MNIHFDEPEEKERFLSNCFTVLFCLNEYREEYDESKDFVQELFQIASFKPEKNE